jgi:type II restriction enzyme
MSEIVTKSIQAVCNGSHAYCKFLSANDTGDTGGHQSGIYIAKNAIPILFSEHGIRGQNKDRFVHIRWQDDFVTESRFTYYGQGSRNEYRVTRFDRGFPFLRTEHTGDLFILVQNTEDEYSAFVLETEDDINAFLDAFSLSPSDTGHLIEHTYQTQETQMETEMTRFISSLTVDFPSSSEMASTARKLFSLVFNHDENIVENPDTELVSWINTEYNLFRKLEYYRYGDLVTKGFASVDHFLETANMVLNRRKSRAGKSLEHHLAAIFAGNSLQYQSQATTEGNKRPDFIFPSASAYHNPHFLAENLVFLGVKTTCKDRWRQIINEADRIKQKHLFTLQQGISIQQLGEMSVEGITLVVPKEYINTYPASKRADIWTLRKFIEFAKEKSA